MYHIIDNKQFKNYLLDNSRNDVVYEGFLCVVDLEWKNYLYDTFLTMPKDVVDIIINFIIESINIKYTIIRSCLAIPDINFNKILNTYYAYEITFNSNEPIFDIKYNFTNTPSFLSCNK